MSEAQDLIPTPAQPVPLYRTLTRERIDAADDRIYQLVQQADLLEFALVLPHDLCVYFAASGTLVYNPGWKYTHIKLSDSRHLLKLTRI